MPNGTHVCESVTFLSTTSTNLISLRVPLLSWHRGSPAVQNKSILLFHYSLLTILLLLHLGSLCQEALSSFTFPILLSSFPALERLFVFFFSPYVTLVLDACFTSYALLLLSA